MIEPYSKEALIRIIFVLIGFVYGVLDSILRPSSDVLDSLFRALCITLLLFIGELLLEISSQIRAKAQNNATELFLAKNRLITGRLLTILTEELQRAVTIKDESVVVEHQTLAISSYDTFWKLLVEEQEHRKASLTVQVLHSSDIDIWVDQPLTQSLLEHQKQFCEKGGLITRILCGRGPKPTEAVRSAANNMANSKITVYYYDMSAGKVPDHNFAWDFARVNETGDAAIWDSFTNKPGSVIDEAIYTSVSDYKRHNLAALWATIHAYSIPFPFEQPRDGE